MNKLSLEKSIEKIVGADDVLVKQSGANVKVEWSHAPLKYAHLAGIAELFGTEAIDVNSGQEAGSCCSGLFDFVELTVRGVDLD